MVLEIVIYLLRIAVLFIVNGSLSMKRMKMYRYRTLHVGNRRITTPPPDVPNPKNLMLFPTRDFEIIFSKYCLVERRREVTE